MHTNGKFRIPRIDQVGFVVRDVEKTAEYYSQQLGIGPWTIMEIGPDIEKMTYYGEPCNFVLKIAVAQVGPVMLELIQPVSGPTPHMDFLKSRGEGVQHLGIFEDNIEESVEKMKSLGYKEISSAYGIGPNKDGAGVYFDTERDLGIAIEFINLPKE